MYDLTISTATHTNTVAYQDFTHAHHALLAHVVGADLYLHVQCPVIQHAPRFTLLRLDEHARRPQIVGTAAIAPTFIGPVISAQRSAQDALDWIAHHTLTWRHGRDTDPGVRYPVAVLSTARAEARHLFTAGTLYPHAARLSDAAEVDLTPPPEIVARLRAHAISTAGSPLDVAGLVASVDGAFTGDLTAAHGAALIWYYALIHWGASTP